jgi:hypothetical protein
VVRGVLHELFEITDRDVVDSPDVIGASLDVTGIGLVSQICLGLGPAGR